MSASWKTSSTAWSSAVYRSSRLEGLGPLCVAWTASAPGFDVLAGQEMQPPYQPVCKNAVDASNFDDFPAEKLPSPEEKRLNLLKTEDMTDMTHSQYSLVRSYVRGMGSKNPLKRLEH